MRIDTIKRAARKEAWYSDSWNPFRKNMGPRRASTWTTASEPNREKDIERGGRDGVLDEGDENPSPLSGVQTEPTFHSQGFSSGSLNLNGARRGSKENEHSMSGAGTNGKQTQEAGSEETAVERRSTTQSSSENQARHRFNPFKRGQDQPPEDDDKPKKRPWYKGKILKHKPYTIKNQLQATIFNSWINILLLAAPVGIALNYAHINGKIIFCVNFIAIIPLAGMLSFATEEIALHVGESLGGLLNASFGYAISFLDFGFR